MAFRQWFLIILVQVTTPINSANHACTWHSHLLTLQIDTSVHNTPVTTHILLMLLSQYKYRLTWYITLTTPCNRYSAQRRDSEHYHGIHGWRIHCHHVSVCCFQFSIVFYFYFYYKSFKLNWGRTVSLEPQTLSERKNQRFWLFVCF